MKKKILHVLSSNDFAGAENVAMCIISNLSDTYDSAYASPIGCIQENLQSRSIIYMPMKKLSVMEIRRIMKEWRPDIIHAHDFTATLKCLCARFSIPVVAQIHQNPTWLQTINRFSILFFLACFPIKKIIVVSPVIKKSTFLSSRFNQKCDVITNIVDINWIKKNALEQTDQLYDLAFVGRLEDIKDPLRFIDIVSKLVKEFPSLKVVMMGEGNMEVQCRELIQRKQLNNVIELKGFMQNPYPVLRNSRLLVMTSRSEGLPIVALEALSLGKPVIVPRLTGIENIIDNSCGYICRGNDEFVTRIASLLKSDTDYMQMSLAASLKGKEICNMDKYKEQMIQVYSSVI